MNYLLCQIVKIICVLGAMLSAAELAAQDQTGRHQKFNPFVYHENDDNFALELGVGAGGSTIGIHTAVFAHADIYHVFIGAGRYWDFDFKQTVSSSAFMLGYRYRTQKIMLALAPGYSRQKFNCTSGLNSDCYNYKEEKPGGLFVYVAGDIILSDEIAIGLAWNSFLSKREQTGVMLTFKFGAFRNIY